MKIKNINLQIELEDGSINQASISSQGYNQWGNETKKLGETVDLMNEIVGYLLETFSLTE